MRAYIADKYPGYSWKEKVRKMSDAQVFAIYKRMEEQKAKGEKYGNESTEVPF